MILRGRTMFDPRLGDADRVCFANRSIPALRYKSKYSQQKKQKIFAPSAFSFAYPGANEKATKKKTPEGDFALCGARRGLRVLDLASL